MTCMSNSFLKYSPRLGKQKIQVADGTYSVAGQGSLQITRTITLQFVLHVPNLDHNLLSIGKITSDMNCSIKITLVVVVFQDHSGKTIELGKLKDGLYYLDTAWECGFKEESQVFGFAQHWCKTYLFWRNRLGHPSFSLMKKLLPSLFTKIEVSNLHCESCILAKNHRVPFAIKEIQFISPFSLIHSDVWVHHVLLILLAIGGLSPSLMIVLGQLESI